MSEAPLTPDERAAAAKSYGLHPLAAEAAIAAQATEGGGVVFSEEGLHVVRDGLKAIDNEPELEDALRSIVKLAAYVGEDLECQEQALRLVAIAGEGALQLHGMRMERNVSSQQDRADRVGGALRRFMGSSEQKRAPMAGQPKTAEDVVKLDALFKKKNISGR